MTKYYISNEATNGYIIGDDANDGLTKSTPWLTANKAFTTGLVTGNEVMFNNGTYPYTASSGKITINLASFQITFENDYKTIIEFTGTSLQGIMFNGSDVEDRELYIGKCYFTYSGTGFTYPIYMGQPTAGANITLRCGVRHVPQAAKASHIFIYHTFKQGLIDIFDGGICATDGGLLDLGTQTMGYLFQNATSSGMVYHDIRVKKFYFNVRAKLTNDVGPLYFIYLSKPTVGKVVVGGVSGKFINTATSGNASIVKLRACPSESAIIASKNLTLVNENDGAFLTAANIQCPSTDQGGAAVCDNALISGWKNIRMFCNQGFTAVMGSEGSDSSMLNSKILDCEFDVYPPTPATATIHGITHTNIPAGGGLRSGNVCNGAAIASLTKNSNAVSTGNSYARTLNTVLYGKGALVGAKFIGETVIIGLDNTAEVEQVLKDSLEGSGCEFEDTKVLAPLGGSFTAATNVIVIGSSSDASVGTTKRLTISETITTGSEFGQVYSDQSGVSIGTWNATAADPKAKKLSVMTIHMSVKNVPSALTNLSYELLNKNHNLIFKGEGLSVDANGDAIINVEGLGVDIGETVYYKLSNHDFLTNADSESGSGRAVVE